MAVCGPHAIPHSIFLGRGWPAPGEALWTDEDRAKQLGWQHNEALRHHLCGQYTDEWLDENGEELRDPPFEVIDVFCPACEALEDARAEAAQGDRPRHGYSQAFRPLLPDN